MTIRRIAFALLMMFFIPVQMAAAQGSPLQIELASPRVDITTGFNGTHVAVFGTRAGDGGDIIITLKGPERTVILRQKKRVIGAWMSSNSMEFRRVPSYYDYVSTRSDMEMQSMPEVLATGQVGVDYLDFYAEDEGESAEETDIFRDALIRRMRAKGFFPIKSGTVQMLSPHFFRSVFELPPGVPTGIYTVEALLVRDTAIVARETRTLQVGQVGFNARVYLFAHDHSFFYGVLAVMIALLSGWSAFTFLRRD